MQSPSVAVIADIVGSRRLLDRAAAQHTIERVIDQIEHAFDRADVKMSATVGDEFEAVFSDLPTATRWLALFRLALPPGLDLRFGLGVGSIESVATATRVLSEGPGWWAAREAIEIVHGLQKRTAPSARTWVVAAAGHDAAMAQTVRLANAYALSHDHIVGAMSARARRLTYGRCLGETQGDLARAEGISQSAVSQALAAAGAGPILEGLTQLVPEVRA